MNNLTISKPETMALLRADPFGIPRWCRAVKNEKDALAFSAHTGLINLENPPLCQCGQRKYLYCNQTRADSNGMGLTWACRREPGVLRCTNRRSILWNTWFHGANIPLLSVLELTLHWFYRVPVTAAAAQLGVSKECAIKRYGSCREVCLNVLTRDDICIGGPGLHVEIDESHLWTRKYHRGRPLASEQPWIFGGIYRETNEVFITLVPG